MDKESPPKDFVGYAQAFFYAGMGLLIGTLCGYYIFTSGWSILGNMVVYIIVAVITLYFIARRSWRRK